MSVVITIAYLTVTVYVARPIARHVYNDLRRPDAEDWVGACIVGLLFGFVWPVFLVARLIGGRRPS